MSPIQIPIAYTCVKCGHESPQQISRSKPVVRCPACGLSGRLEPDDIAHVERSIEKLGRTLTKKLKITI